MSLGERLTTTDLVWVSLKVADRFEVWNGVREFAGAFLDITLFASLEKGWRSATFGEGDFIIGPAQTS